MSVSPPVPALRPIAQSERIHILDILRGFAIFGILAVNIGGFSSPAFYPGYFPPEHLPWYDELAETLMLFFAEGKFYTIFSFLFGLGFAVQLGRAEAKGVDVRSFYPRRLWVLLGLGVLHAILLWIGDILRLYALLGFVLLAFRKRSDQTIRIWAVIFFIIGFILLGLVSGPETAGADPTGMDVIAKARLVYTGNSPISVVIFQVFASVISFFVIAMTQAGTALALFLLGLLAGRSKFFEQLEQHRAVFYKVIVWGGIIGLIFNALFVFGENTWVMSLGFTIGAPAFAAMYISLLSLASLTPRGKALLTPIAAVGRMALSNYVLQSVVCSLIFNGYGLGLFEKVGAAGLWGITFAIYLLQIPLSVWWLRHFQFGPLEWVWRSLTYGKRQPFVRVEVKP